MDYEDRKQLALGVLNALIYDGPEDEETLRIVMIILDEEDPGILDTARQEAGAMILEWANKMQRTIDDMICMPDQDDPAITDEPDVINKLAFKDLPEYYDE